MEKRFRLSGLVVVAAVAVAVVGVFVVKQTCRKMYTPDPSSRGTNGNMLYSGARLRWSEAAQSLRC